MAKSSLTEGLKLLQSIPSSQERRGQPTNSEPEHANTTGSQDGQALGAETASMPEIGLEIKAILSQSVGSFSWERNSFFGCSPPARSDNGLVRDRTFGRCIPIRKAEAMSPSQVQLQQ